MNGKRAIISVINDLVTDKRVDKTAQVLADLGFEVILLGRHRNDSLRMRPRRYETIRMRLLWEKGPLFYIEFTTRLFLFLLFNKVELLVSNDLDTLLPNYIISKLKRIPIVFDSHEFYTETPELTGRPFVKGIWRHIEQSIVPHLKDCLTVSDSLAKLFKEKYGSDFKVVRNIAETPKNIYLKSRSELGLPYDKKIVILQGAGINMHRGAEEAIEAMQYLHTVILLIIGGGDKIPFLINLAQQNGLNEKVIFLSKQSPEQLFSYTAIADLVLSLDKDTNINYRYSLPNKLFDYIQAGIPVLASPLPEIKNIIEHFHIGEFIESHDPKHIAAKIREMLDNKVRYDLWKQNLELAKTELNWEKEKQTLINIFRKYA
jgi:glycosyltransferase involved in cell wall biosynthesis